MNAIDRLNDAADQLAWVAPGDPLLLAVADWLRAEAVMQSSMGPLTELLSMAIQTSGGPSAVIAIGTDDDGELAMHGSTNDHALAVADEIQRRFAPRPSPVPTGTGDNERGRG